MTATQIDPWPTAPAVFGTKCYQYRCVAPAIMSKTDAAQERVSRN
jgi:hypothetical protein